MSYKESWDVATTHRFCYSRKIKSVFKNDELAAEVYCSSDKNKTGICAYQYCPDRAERR